MFLFFIKGKDAYDNSTLLGKDTFDKSTLMRIYGEL